MKIFRSGEGEIQDIISGQCVLGHGLLNIEGVNSFRDVLFLLRTDVALDGDYLAVLASDET